MSNAIVPRSDLSHDLGTEAKRFKEIHGKKIVVDEIGGAVADDLNNRATNQELQRVEGEIENAAAPNYYEESEAFYDASQDRESNTQIISPAILWLNINGQGRKLTEQVTLDIDDHSVWDTKATVICTDARRLARPLR